MAERHFLVGSDVFFGKMSDYVTHGYSLLYFDDNPDYEIETSYMEGNNHILRWRNIGKEQLIFYHQNCWNGRYIGKFLVPEVAEYLQFTIEDLKQIGNLVNCLDERHLYEKIIYDAYIENNGFFMTDEQLNAAYAEYKRERGK